MLAFIYLKFITLKIPRVALHIFAQQIDTPVSHEALVATGAVKSAVMSGLVCVRFLLKFSHLMCNSFIEKVRLVSEEFGTLIEKRFIKDIPAIDLKFIRSFSSRNPHPSHPLGLSLALHTARLSARISQDKSLLYDKSTTSVSAMMDILLRAAGNCLRST